MQFRRIHFPIYANTFRIWTNTFGNLDKCSFQIHTTIAPLLFTCKWGQLCQSFFQTNSGIKKGQENISDFATQNFIQISIASNMFQGLGVKLKITFTNYFQNFERMFDNLGHCKICLLPAGIELGCRGEEFKIPMFKIPTFIIPMVQNTNEALSKYHLKVHNTNKLKRVKFLQFKIPTGWYYEHSVHNTNYNCCHGWVSPITLIYAQWLHIRRGRVMWGKWAKLTCCMI